MLVGFFFVEELGVDGEVGEARWATAEGGTEIVFEEEGEGFGWWRGEVADFAEWWFVFRA